MSQEVQGSMEVEAAQDAAKQAAEQARETAEKAVATIKAMDSNRLAYLGLLAVVLVSTLIFDMASFSVGTDYAVSETTAQAQREAEAKLNSWAYSAFSSSMWGKLMWVSALGGIGLLVWSAMTTSRLAWVPLALIGCAAMSTLCLLLLYVVGFPDLSAYSDASCSATLLGYWLPLIAASTATFFAAKPIFLSK